VRGGTGRFLAPPPRARHPLDALGATALRGEKA